MVSAVILLVRCRYCRNSIRYLYSPWSGWRHFRIRLRRRMLALTLIHRGHKPGCMDSHPPVKWRDRVKS